MRTRTARGPSTAAQAARYGWAMARKAVYLRTTGTTGRGRKGIAVTEAEVAAYLRVTLLADPGASPQCEMEVCYWGMDWAISSWNHNGRPNAWQLVWNRVAAELAAEGQLVAHPEAA